MKKIILVLLIFAFFACTSTVPTHKTFLPWLAEVYADSLSDNQLIFIFSDKMCAECINAEFQHLSESALPLKPMLVGIFHSKRVFYSTIKRIGEKCSNLYIDPTDCHCQQMFNVPFYCIYDADEERFSTPFYPEVCNTELTVKYYEQVLNLQKANILKIE